MGGSILIILIFALINYPAAAQQHIFKTYTVQDGLVANNVRRVMQDSKGFIWIATWEGLSKYDGHRFINYSPGNGLSHDVVNDVYEDKNGSLYIALNNTVLDVIQNDRIQQLLRDSIAINQFFIRDDSTVLVISDLSGVGDFRSGKISAKKEQPISSIQDYAKLNDSLSAVLDSDYQLAILDKNYGIYQRPAIPIVLSSISIDSRKNLWLCGQGGL